MRPILPLFLLLATGRCTEGSDLGAATHINPNASDDAATGSGEGGTSQESGLSADLGYLLTMDVGQVDCIERHSELGAVNLAMAGAPSDVFAMDSSHYAYSHDSLEFARLPGDGDEDALPLESNVLAMAASDSTFAQLLRDGSSRSVVLSHPVASSLEIDANLPFEVPAATCLSIAHSPVATALVYGTSIGQFARVVSADLSRSNDVLLADESSPFLSCVSRIAFDGDSFGVAWTTVSDSEVAATQFARVSATGSVIASRSLIVTTGSHQLTGFSAVPGGFALQINEGEKSFASVLLRISHDGQIELPISRLRGTAFGQGLSCFADACASTVVRSDGRSALYRVSGLTGLPTRKPECLDDLIPFDGFGGVAAAQATSEGVFALSKLADESFAFGLLP